MADVAKYHLISASNGASSFFPDLKHPFQAHKSKELLSRFFLLFVTLTLLHAFTPSYSSLWFNSIFSGSLTATSSSPTVTGSDSPSLSAYYFSNSSPQTTPSSPSPPRSRDDAALTPLVTTQTTLRPPSSINTTIESTSRTDAPPPEVVKEKDVKPNFTASLSKKKQGSDATVQSNATAKALVPAPTAATPPPAKDENWLSKMNSCDLYDGNWVWDDSYPLYKPGSCELVDEQFNCFTMGGLIMAISSTDGPNQWFLQRQRWICVDLLTEPI